MKDKQHNAMIFYKKTKKETTESQNTRKKDTIPNCVIKTIRKLFSNMPLPDRYRIINVKPLHMGSTLWCRRRADETFLQDFQAILEYLENIFLCTGSTYLF